MPLLEVAAVLFSPACAKARQALLRLEAAVTNHKAAVRFSSGIIR